MCPVVLLAWMVLRLKSGVVWGFGHRCCSGYGADVYSRFDRDVPSRGKGSDKQRDAMRLFVQVEK